MDEYILGINQIKNITDRAIFVSLQTWDMFPEEDCCAVINGNDVRLLKVPIAIDNEYRIEILPRNGRDCETMVKFFGDRTELVPLKNTKTGVRYESYRAAFDPAKFFVIKNGDIQHIFCENDYDIAIEF